jgi:hypothetical protein
VKLAKGRNAIREFLKDNNKKIDPSIRRMARTDPTYLPEAATTSRRLAIHFVTSKEGNIQCGYHAYKNKSTFMRDGWGKVGQQIRGVPGKRKISAGKGKKAGVVKPPAKGLGNCGCKIEDILLEFVLWKRIKIQGTVGGSTVEEMMVTQDYLEPRDRSFFFEALRGLTSGVTLDDFFMHGGSGPHQEMKIAKKQALYCLRVLNTKYKIRAMDEFAFKELTIISKKRLLDLLGKEKRLAEVLVTQMLVT